MMIRLIGVLAAGGMLFAAYPPLEWGTIAWVALVPLLLICERSTPAEAFRWGLASGLIFWLTSIVWIARVSNAGWFLLALYCALYVALFAFSAAWLMRRLKPLGIFNRFALLLMVPALWVGLEYARSTFLTGFPWNALGVSQYASLPIIQSAEWGGVYAVSFLIVMLNMALTLMLMPRQSLSGQVRYWPKPELLVAVAVIAFFYTHGFLVVRAGRGSPDFSAGGDRSGKTRLALIQLNVPQFQKWAEEWSDQILDRLQNETQAAIRRFKPDLVVWPETVMPDFVRFNGPSREAIFNLLTNGVPILAGSMDMEELGNEEIRYYNCSFLFHSSAAPIQRYAKRQLVIFGEYIPLEGVLPFIRALTPIEGSFTPGDVSTIFRLEPGGAPFAVLICFEDTVAWLARESVRNGARLLINQTNDAWFDPSSAARQHMAHGVFRCVENRVPAARSTNTGLTCFIDRFGAVHAALAPARDEMDEPESLARNVRLPPRSMPLTFYTRHGDVFAMACLTLALTTLATALFGAWLGRRRAPGGI